MFARSLIVALSFLAFNASAQDWRASVESELTKVAESIGAEDAFSRTLVSKKDYNGVAAKQIRYSRSIATAVFDQGQCTMVVDEDEITRPLNSSIKLAGLTSEDIQRFVFVHEFAHCVVRNLLQQEIMAIAAGREIEGVVFTNPRVLELARSGQLTQATFQNVMDSEENELREEKFADGVALAWSCNNSPEKCAALLETIQMSRVRGDARHRTSDFLDKVNAMLKDKVSFSRMVVNIRQAL